MNNGFAKDIMAIIRKYDRDFPQSDIVNLHDMSVSQNKGFLMKLPAQKSARDYNREDSRAEEDLLSSTALEDFMDGITGIIAEETIIAEENEWEDLTSSSDEDDNDEDVSSDNISIISGEVQSHVLRDSRLTDEDDGDIASLGPPQKILSDVHISMEDTEFGKKILTESSHRIKEVAEDELTAVDRTLTASIGNDDSEGFDTGIADIGDDEFPGNHLGEGVLDLKSLSGGQQKTCTTISSTFLVAPGRPSRRELNFSQERSVQIQAEDRAVLESSSGRGSSCDDSGGTELQMSEDLTEITIPKNYDGHGHREARRPSSSMSNLRRQAKAYNSRSSVNRLVGNEPVDTGYNTYGNNSDNPAFLALEATFNARCEKIRKGVLCPAGSGATECTRRPPGRSVGEGPGEAIAVPGATECTYPGRSVGEGPGEAVAESLQEKPPDEDQMERVRQWLLGRRKREATFDDQHLSSPQKSLKVANDDKEDFSVRTLPSSPLGHSQRRYLSRGSPKTPRSASNKTGTRGTPTSKLLSPVHHVIREFQKKSVSSSPCRRAAAKPPSAVQESPTTQTLLKSWGAQMSLNPPTDNDRHSPLLRTPTSSRGKKTRTLTTSKRLLKSWGMELNIDQTTVNDTHPSPKRWPTTTRENTITPRNIRRNGSFLPVEARQCQSGLSPRTPASSKEHPSTAQRKQESIPKKAPKNPEEVRPASSASGRDENFNTTYVVKDGAREATPNRFFRHAVKSNINIPRSNGRSYEWKLGKKPPTKRVSPDGGTPKQQGVPPSHTGISTGMRPADNDDEGISFVGNDPYEFTDGVSIPDTFRPPHNSTMISKPPAGVSGRYHKPGREDQLRSPETARQSSKSSSIITNSKRPRVVSGRCRTPSRNHQPRSPETAKHGSKLSSIMLEKSKRAHSRLLQQEGQDGTSSDKENWNHTAQNHTSSSVSCGGPENCKKAFCLECCHSHIEILPVE